jgi:3-methyladenine DNA glycosylase AlkD
MHHVVADIVAAYKPVADSDRAAPMAKYMRDQFPFLGIAAPIRDAVLKPILKAWQPADVDELSVVATELWNRREREYHYAGGRLLCKYADRVGPEVLLLIVKCAQTHSWWDTVDELTHAVGDVAKAYPQTIPTIESWIDNQDFWLARLAILHQLGYGDTVNLARLGQLCLARSHDPEFFIRKGIGWALRDASYAHPQWVTDFIRTHDQVLSPLSKREGMKAIIRRQKAIIVDDGAGGAD